MTLLALRRERPVPELDAPGAPADGQVLAPTALPLLPRVDLLPAEIAERRRFQQVQLGLGAAVVATLGAVGLLYGVAAGKVADAEESLATATASAAELQAQVSGMAEVTTVFAEAAAARQVLGRAMGQEVRFSRLLADLSTGMPEGVWLDSVTWTQTAGPVAPGSAGTAGAAGPTHPVGTVQVAGTALSHRDVAAWLDALARQSGYSGVTLSGTGATRTDRDGRQVVAFTSSATLTTAALSGRYAATGG